ncbi:SH3 domain-containing protein [Aurantimonas coralicida]|uniref:SH3 domain-containing protein n=1 Tax=Aurantimonas coralicida TaxID=182270 RepID=UPI001E4B689D|nr:SH3 domain-containing protein [Aurantimonas coralicida]MCD1644377.1 SH3 domain-containing protein [Aurantimonas coralicida]
MNKMLFAALAVASAITLPASAQAQSRAIATTDVNLRAGPSTSYPAVNVVGAGDRVRVFGCLDTRAWCDVGYDGQRGWMSSNYLADARERRYTGPRYVDRMDAPVISFSIGRYWDDHYRGRNFYRDRDRYDDRRGRDRRDFDRRDDRRDARRDARRDFREDRRDDRREFREDLRDDRRNYREERRDERPVPLYRLD